MKHLLWLGIIASLNFGVTVPPAAARMAIEAPAAKGGGVAVTQARKSGVIGYINLGAGTMEVGGVKYFYTPALARVYRRSGNPPQDAAVNPLNLRSGSQVEFLARKEGARERITDVWLIEDRP